MLKDIWLREKKQAAEQHNGMSPVIFVKEHTCISVITGRKKSEQIYLRLLRGVNTGRRHLLSEFQISESELLYRGYVQLL